MQDKATKAPFDPALGVANGLYIKGLEPKYSIFLYSGTGTCDGISGDHLLLAPPYTVSRADIETIAERTRGVVTEYFEECIPK